VHDGPGSPVVEAAVVGIAVVGIAVVGIAVVGIPVVGTAVVGIPVVGIAVVGTAFVGIPVVGIAVVGIAVVGGGQTEGVPVMFSSQKSLRAPRVARPPKRKNWNAGLVHEAASSREPGYLVPT